MPNKQPTAAEINTHIADPFKYAARQNRKTGLLQIQTDSGTGTWHNVPRQDRVELYST